MELKARKNTKPAAAPETLQDRVTAAFNQQDAAERRTQESGGAAEAVGVLTALDEDEGGGDEAPMPGEFDYDTDEPKGED